jgi:hypothetical protein
MCRRAALLVAMIVAALLLDSATASAEPTTALNREVSGPFAGTTFFDFFTNSCSFIHQTLDGIYATTVQSQTGTFHLDVCPTFDATGGLVGAGSFAIHDRRGSTLIGIVTGTYDISTTTSIPFAFMLQVVTGTRAFRHVGGTISLTGVWDFHGDPAPIAGTLVGSLTQ